MIRSESPFVRARQKRIGDIIVQAGGYLRVTATGTEPFTPTPHPAQTGRVLHCVGAGGRSHHVERELIV